MAQFEHNYAVQSDSPDFLNEFNEISQARFVVDVALDLPVNEFILICSPYVRSGVIFHR